MTGSPSRARRLSEGWSANLLQMALGIAQQVALVPVFLHYWSNDILAAWLAIYAAGNLVLIVDAGLQFRAINRFLAFKSSVDCDRRSGQFYAEMLRIYLGVAAALAVLLVIAAQFLSPSFMFGFRSIAQFDLAFGIMVVGMLLTLPANIAAALYRARGFYGRAVKLVNLGMMGALFGQLAAVMLTQSLFYVTIVYVAAQLSAAAYLLMIDAPRLFPYLASFARRLRLRWRAPPIWRCSICRCCWSARLCPIASRWRNGASPASSPDCCGWSASRRPFLWLPSSATIMRRATSNDCEAFTLAARCW
jgi:hypothetical protein